IRKGSVALAEQPSALYAECAHHLRRHQRTRAIAAVVDDAHRAAEWTGALDDVRHVTIDQCLAPHRSIAGWRGARRNERVQVLNVMSVQRLGAEAQLESIVLG